MTNRVQQRLVPGDGLLHPVVVAALTVLLVNDHILKARFPGAITGKLSDFAGLVMFPLFIQALIEVVSSARRRFVKPSNVVLTVSILVSAAAFSALQLIPQVGDAYQVGFGWLRSLPEVLHGLSAPRVALTQDPTDLVALVSLIVAWHVGARRSAIFRESRLARSPGATRSKHTPALSVSRRLRMSARSLQRWRLGD